MIEEEEMGGKRKSGEEEKEKEKKDEKGSASGERDISRNQSTLAPMRQAHCSTTDGPLSPSWIENKDSWELSSEDTLWWHAQ